MNWCIFGYFKACIKITRVRSIEAIVQEDSWQILLLLVFHNKGSSHKSLSQRRHVPIVLDTIIDIFYHNMV